MAQALTTTIFAVHIVGGAVGMASGLTAVCARKGGRLHRTAGDVFVVSMAVMAVFAAVLGVIRPGQIINVFIAGLTLYLVLTAWLTARRRSTPPGAPSLLGRVVERKRDRGGNLDQPGTFGPSPVSPSRPPAP